MKIFDKNKDGCLDLNDLARYFSKSRTKQALPLIYLLSSLNWSNLNISKINRKETFLKGMHMKVHSPLHIFRAILYHKFPHTTRKIWLFDNSIAHKIFLSFSIRILALDENFLLKFQIDVSAFFSYLSDENMSENHVATALKLSSVILI